MASAAKKQYGLGKNVDVSFDEQTGEIDVKAAKEVVRIVQNPQSEILLDEARKENPDIQVGDFLSQGVETEGLGRIAAQIAKQVILQRVREAERANIYEEFKEREGDLITGSVSQVERGNIYVDIGRTEAILPRREQIFREVYKRGDRIRASIMEVREITKGPQIVLSRTHPGLLIRLFEMEVPEIYDGIVAIKDCVREPSGRSKVSVVSHERDIDPVGACVGTRGSRVQSIVQELRGEKIDIISWSDDIRTYAANALSPAKIQHITLFDDEGRMEVLVPDDQLSLAIGKGGQNVRLAAKLLGWKIDLKGEGEYRRIIAEQAFSSDDRQENVADVEDQDESIQPTEADGDSASELIELDLVGEKMARLLADNGFSTIAAISAASTDELCEVPGIGPKRAELLIEAARSHEKSTGMESHEG
ncbi:Transcription termination/antitermination protein NusA [Geodia barretti]|uniref:Transcription termination/antitermination protein NusA n=2 Tax=Geodia barretti TaxID=519541 RepID=A0AA35R430_GEOBA|nr:Transcription termination/antitermination protein NusA [Geodia barretti]